MSFLEGSFFKDTMPLSADERDFNHCAHYVHITKRGSGWVAIIIVVDCVSDNAYCQKTVGHIAGHLLVSLGFGISGFSRNMVVRYRGINNKGVLDRPWTIWMVLRAIFSTLKFQFTVNPES